MNDITTEPTITELVDRAQHHPELLTEQDITSLSAEFSDLAATITETLTPLFQILIDVFATMTDALLPYIEYMPGREFRRFRKNRRLREHRERVAARRPAWKRTP